MTIDTKSIFDQCPGPSVETPAGVEPTPALLPPGGARSDWKTMLAPGARPARIVAFAATAIFLLCIVVRCTLVIHSPAYAQAPYGESLRVAQSLVKGQGFSNPYLIPTGPTAHLTPFLPLLQAAILSLTHDGNSLRWTLFFVAVFFTSASWALLPMVAAELGLPVVIGIMAGTAGAVSPTFFDMDGSWMPSTGAFALLGVLIVVARNKCSPTPRLGFCCGLICGLAMLIHATLALPILGYWIFLEKTVQVKAGLVRIARFSGPMLAGVTLVLLPWVVRNRIVLGHWVWLRSNAGFNFFLSNRDGALADVDSNIFRKNGDVPNPYSSLSEAQLVARLGEIGYNQRCWQMFKAWVREHPHQFVKLTAERFKLFWLPARRTGSGRAGEELLLLLALCGSALVWRYGQLPGRAVGITLLSYPLIYYFVEVHDRYRYPLRPILFLCAAIALWELVLRSRNSLRSLENTSVRPS